MGARAAIRSTSRRSSPLPSPPSPQDWRDAATLVAPGTFAGVRYGDSELPAGWQTVDTFDLVQMIGERLIGVDCSEAIPLGAADVPEMLELVAQTQPGPLCNAEHPEHAHAVRRAGARLN